MQFEQPIMTSKGVEATIWKMKAVHIDVENQNVTAFLDGYVNETATSPLETHNFPLEPQDAQQIIQSIYGMVSQIFSGE